MIRVTELFPCVLTTLVCCVVSQKMGPFDVIGKSFEYCGPRGSNVLFVETRLKKYNRTMFVLDANASLPSDVDDSVRTTLELSKLTQNGWKDNYLKAEFPMICKFFKTYLWDKFISLLKAAHLPPSCPITEGNFSVVNYPLDIQLRLLPSFEYSKYKWKVVLYKGKRLFSCFQGLVDIVPQQKRRS